MEEREVTLPEMLEAREKRAFRQASLAKLHHCPVICFTLNIPGPKKTGEAFEWVFETGVERIGDALHKAQMPVRETRISRSPAGYEYYASVVGDPLQLKKLMTEIEDGDSLGRLFDIDVLTVSLDKISRTQVGEPPRRCLLCGEDAHACARSRRHSVAELVRRIEEIIAQSRWG